ncbi:MAG: hypothetical protein PV340_02865 [Wolbachia sp.]|nr:hypothetical protein [Wolbachia sp.]
MNVSDAVRQGTFLISVPEVGRALRKKCRSTEINLKREDSRKRPKQDMLSQALRLL